MKKSVPQHGSNNDSSVIKISDVHKSYCRGNNVTNVLNGIDLQVRQGQCVFLAGPSGSGKSTLLSILGCILTPDSGEVRLFGKDTQRLGNRARTRLRRDQIGFVFQRFHLIRGLTAYDNVCVPLLLRGVSRRHARRRAMHLLELVGLANKANEHPQNLSAGQSQRVAFARALIGDPEIILADEPTASLDAESGHEAMKLLRRLLDEARKTAVVVTHDSRIFEYADRICLIDKGVLSERAQDADAMPAIRRMPVK